MCRKSLYVLRDFGTPCSKKIISFLNCTAKLPSLLSYKVCKNVYISTEIYGTCFATE